MHLEKLARGRVSSPVHPEVIPPLVVEWDRIDRYLKCVKQQVSYTLKNMLAAGPDFKRQHAETIF